MKFKFLFFIIFCGICVFLVGKLLFYNQTIRSKRQQSIHLNDMSGGGQKNELIQIPSKEERSRMTLEARIALFEKLGRLPDDPIYIDDYRVAEKTSWWGKRLDPEVFWKNRVVWVDYNTSKEAGSRGRLYPPIPYEDPSILNISDVDIQMDYGSWEFPTPRKIYSLREKAFWDNFKRIYPVPPESIQFWMRQEAERWLRHNKTLDTNLTRSLQSAKTFNLPIECVSPEIFTLTYVLQKREEYEKLLTTENAKLPHMVEYFWNHVYVDHSLITEPLTQAQLDAANAWKVAYLNRLREEKWDESYIKAYLEAWNLTEEYVFGKRGGKK